MHLLGRGYSTHAVHTKGLPVAHGISSNRCSLLVVFFVKKWSEAMSNGKEIKTKNYNGFYCYWLLAIVHIHLVLTVMTECHK